MQLSYLLNYSFVADGGKFLVYVASLKTQNSCFSHKFFTIFVRKIVGFFHSQTLALIVSQTVKKLTLRKIIEMEQKKIYGYFIVTLFAFFLFYKPIFCFLILGILLMYYSVDSLIFFDYINKKGIKTNGKILSYEKDEDGHKTPIIEFKTLEGNLIAKKPHYYASTDLSIVKTNQNNINKNIEILYSPKKPEMFIMEKEKNFNYGSVIFMIFGGLIFSGIAIGQIFGIIKIDM